MHTIGQAAKLTGVKVTTIRYYEAEGLLPRLARSASGQRVFDEGAIARLNFIQHARQMGFAPQDLKSLLDLRDSPAAPCAQADAIAQQHIRQIDQRISQLTALKAELSRMLSHCPGATAADCTVLETLSDHDTHCAHNHGDIRT